MGALAHAFFNDERVQVALLVVILDLALGVLAALKTKTFRLSYVSDTLRADVLWKVLPFFILYAGYKYAAGADVVIPGLDMEVLMNGAWVLTLAALTGSILNSVKELGLTQLPEPVAGNDPATPEVPPNP